MRENNQACLAFVSNPKAIVRNKHIEIAYHMFREYVAREEVAFYFLNSADMPAQSRTKPLPAPAFTTFRRVICVGLDLVTSGSSGMRVLRPAPQC